MKVYELINLLKTMPFHLDVKMDDGKHLHDPRFVEKDGRDYVIIREAWPDDDN